MILSILAVVAAAVAGRATSGITVGTNDNRVYPNAEWN